MKPLFTFKITLKTNHEKSSQKWQQKRSLISRALVFYSLAISCLFFQIQIVSSRVQVFPHEKYLDLEDKCSPSDNHCNPADTLFLKSLPEEEHFIPASEINGPLTKVAQTLFETLHRELVEMAALMATSELHSDVKPNCNLDDLLANIQKSCLSDPANEHINPLSKILASIGGRNTLSGEVRSSTPKTYFQNISDLYKMFIGEAPGPKENLPNSFNRLMASSIADVSQDLQEIKGSDVLERIMQQMTFESSPLSFAVTRDNNFKLQMEDISWLLKGFHDFINAKEDNFSNEQLNSLWDEFISKTSETALSEHHINTGKGKKESTHHSLKDFLERDIVTQNHKGGPNAYLTGLYKKVGFYLAQEGLDLSTADSSMSKKATLKALFLSGGKNSLEGNNRTDRQCTELALHFTLVCDSLAKLLPTESKAEEPKVSLKSLFGEDSNINGKLRDAYLTTSSQSLSPKSKLLLNGYSCQQQPLSTQRPDEKGPMANLFSIANIYGINLADVMTEDESLAKDGRLSSMEKLLKGIAKTGLQNMLPPGAGGKATTSQYINAAKKLAQNIGSQLSASHGRMSSIANLPPFSSHHAPSTSMASHTGTGPGHKATTNTNRNTPNKNQPQTKRTDGSTKQPPSSQTASSSKNINQRNNSSQQRSNLGPSAGRLPRNNTFGGTGGRGTSNTHHNNKYASNGQASTSNNANSQQGQAIENNSREKRNNRQYMDNSQKPSATTRQTSQNSIGAVGPQSPTSTNNKASSSKRVTANSIVSPGGINPNRSTYYVNPSTNNDFSSSPENPPSNAFDTTRDATETRERDKGSLSFEKINELKTIYGISLNPGLTKEAQLAELAEIEQLLTSLENNNCSPSDLENPECLTLYMRLAEKNGGTIILEGTTYVLEAGGLVPAAVANTSPQNSEKEGTEGLQEGPLIGSQDQKNNNPLKLIMEHTLVKQ